MRRSRRVLAAAVSAASTLALVTGCSSSLGEPPAVATPHELAGLPARIDYVALGDSFSAGPLIPNGRQDPGGCLRSTNNYPAFLAGYFEVASYVDVTCSGAATADLRRGQVTLIPGPANPPQLSALNADTDLVTIGIGGNDFGLFGSLIGTCGDLRRNDPTGSPCRHRFTDGRGRDSKARDARRIRTRVAAALRQIHERAPDARVLVIGYPRLLPETGTCGQAPLAAGDYAWSNRIGRLLNRSLRLAAEQNDATYVDLYRASRGHDVCAGKRAWVNGKTMRFGQAASFHPFVTGMRGVATEIFRRLTGLPAPGGATASPPVGSVVTNDVG